MLKKSLTGMLCLIAGIFTHTALANHPAAISDAWIADAPPIAKIRACYLKMHNEGKHAITVSNFSSPNFERIELHKTIIENGMMKMEKIKQLTIKPGQHIEFKPGGYHLMLFTPRHNLNKGDKINFTIRFKDKLTSSFTAVVRQRGDGMQHDHHQHH